GTTIEQFVRCTKRDGLREDRIRTRREVDAQLSGRLADEYGQAMLACGNRSQKRWHARFDRRHSGTRTGHVLFFADARITANLVQPQCFSLVIETAIEHGEPLLKAAKLEVVEPDVRRHTDTHVFERGLEALSVG